MAFGTLIEALIADGLISANLFTNQAIFIGNALQLMLLSMGLADRSNYKQQEALIKEKRLSEKLEFSKQKVQVMYKEIEKSNQKLEDQVKKENSRT